MFSRERETAPAGLAPDSIAMRVLPTHVPGGLGNVGVVGLGDATAAFGDCGCVADSPEEGWSGGTVE